MGNARITWPTESVKQSSYELTETELASKVLTRVYTWPFLYVLWLFAWCLNGIPNNGSSCISDSLLALGDCFLLLVCLV